MTRPVWGKRFVAAACVMWLSTQLQAQTPWTTLRGEGFMLRGQVSPAKLADIACDLETAVRTLRGSTPAGEAPKVVAVDSARGIREWLPQFNDRGRGNPLGAYWRGLYGDHIVVRIDAPRAERLRRVLHEYAHFVTHVAQPEPPRWLDEGLSEVWEHAEIAPGRIKIGRPVGEHLKRLRAAKNWIPVRELLAANLIPTRTASASAMFYAESWALVHYLMIEKRLGQGVLNRVPDTSELPSDEVLKGYIQGPMASPVTISIVTGPSGCPSQGNLSQATPFETLLYRAQALADGELPDAALPLLKEALRLNRDSSDAMETIGFISFRGNRPIEAASIFDQLIAAGTASHISFYYRSVLAGPVPELSGGGPVPQLEYVRKALALNPGFAPAVQRLKELTGSATVPCPLALGMRQ